MQEEVRKGWWDPGIFDKFQTLMGGTDDRESVYSNGGRFSGIGHIFL
jgi:hypothetical protein